MSRLYKTLIEGTTEKFTTAKDEKTAEDKMVSRFREENQLKPDAPVKAKTWYIGRLES